MSAYHHFRFYLNLDWWLYFLLTIGFMAYIMFGDYIDDIILYPDIYLKAFR